MVITPEANTPKACKYPKSPVHWVIYLYSEVVQKELVTEVSACLRLPIYFHYNTSNNLRNYQFDFLRSCFEND